MNPNKIILKGVKLNFSFEIEELQLDFPDADPEQLSQLQQAFENINVKFGELKGTLMNIQDITNKMQTPKNPQP